MAEGNYATEVAEFVLDLDAIIRIDGVAGDIDDDANFTIEAALRGAREKYGIHFESDEAIVLRDKDGSYCGSSMPVNIQGTFHDKEDSVVPHDWKKLKDTRRAGSF